MMYFLVAKRIPTLIGLVGLRRKCDLKYIAPAKVVRNSLIINASCALQTRKSKMLLLIIR